MIYNNLHNLLRFELMYNFKNVEVNIPYFIEIRYY